MHKSEKHVSVTVSETSIAASEKCYLISTGPSIFVFSIQISHIKIFIYKNSLPLVRCLFNLLTSMSSRGTSRTPAGTKIDFVCDNS